MSIHVGHCCISYTISFLREPQWTTDEYLFSRLVNTTVMFSESGNFDETVVRIGSFNVGAYSVSPATDNYYVVCHVPGTQGQPAFAK